MDMNYGDNHLRAFYDHFLFFVSAENEWRSPQGQIILTRGFIRFLLYPKLKKKKKVMALNLL